MHHVILGAGPAGVVAAETLRKADPDSQITLIGGEGEPPYSRMAIPYYLSGGIVEVGTYLRLGSNHYESLNIDFVQGRASAIFAGRKQIRLEGGKEIDYGKLLLATGATPIWRPIEGLRSPGVHACWTLEDARNIIHLAERDQPVVLMGAGFIGSIILEALVKKGVNLTVVEREDRMVPRMMDETAGAMLKNWCETRGLRVLTATEITKVNNATNGLTVSVSSGEQLPAKLLVVATGVSPNIGYLASSGIKIDHGIEVDDHMATNVPDIYAAGDVAQAKNMSTGEYSVLAIQPTAVEHGRVAALNMAGRPTPYQGSLNMNVLDTIGLISSSFGSWMGVSGGQSARTVDEARCKYLRLEFDGDILVGAQTIGLTDHIGMVRGLIQTGLPLGAWKEKLMKSPERLAEAYVATAQGIHPA